MFLQKVFWLAYSVNLISLILLHSISADDEDNSPQTKAEGLAGILKMAAEEKSLQGTTTGVFEREHDCKQIRGDCDQSEVSSNEDLGYSLSNETVIAVDQGIVCDEHQHCEHEEQLIIDGNKTETQSEQQQENGVGVEKLSKEAEGPQELPTLDEVKKLEKYNTLVKWIEENGGFMRYHSFKYTPGAGVGVVARENITVH